MTTRVADDIFDHYMPNLLPTQPTLDRIIDLWIRELLFTTTMRTFLPFLMYPVLSPFLHSSGSEDTIFDPGIVF